MKAIIILSAAALLSYLVTPALSEELPDAKEVKTVSIEFSHPRLDDVKFDATADDWKAIREHLLPARHDPNPAKWLLRGSVKMVTKDGEPYVVELYHSNSGPGAFAAGKTYEDRAYYRGGNSAKVLQALLAAHENAKNKIRAQQDGGGQPATRPESK